MHSRDYFCNDPISPRAASRRDLRGGGGARERRAYKSQLRCKTSNFIAFNNIVRKSTEGVGKTAKERATRVTLK